MILVVCPNLAIDVTLDVETLTPGKVHRARRAEPQAGGKGVNLARAATALGEPVVVLGFVGGDQGAEIARRLSDEAIDARLVAIEGESRTCTILLEPTGVATVVNENGPAVENPGALIKRYDAILGEARAVALMGSLQPGLPTNLYAELVVRARARDRFCLVDAAGNVLEDALAARPSLVKPNRAEAEALLGRPLESDRACMDATAALRRAGAEIAIVTRAARGVIVASDDGVARCASSTTAGIHLGNPTGAGDALAAGLLVGHLRGYPHRDMVRLGVAAATASLAEGFGRFRAKDVRIDAVDFIELN